MPLECTLSPSLESGYWAQPHLPADHSPPKKEPAPSPPLGPPQLDQSSPRSAPVSACSPREHTGLAGAPGEVGDPIVATKGVGVLDDRPRGLEVGRREGLWSAPPPAVRRALTYTLPLSGCRMGLEHPGSQGKSPWAECRPPGTQTRRLPRPSAIASVGRGGQISLVHTPWASVPRTPPGRNRAAWRAPACQPFVRILLLSFHSSPTRVQFTS